ncbi:MAG: PAS domain S-box protein, partial [Betaproteobacteria bacterium]
MATRRRRTAGARKAITRGRDKPAGGAMRARTAERALRASAARFRSLTQLSADWYWEQDAEFRLTHTSSYVGDKSGLDASIYLGRKRWEQPALNLTEADWERHRAQLERREPFRDFEIQRAASDGHSVWLSLSGEPVFDDRGRFKGYRGVGRDVTAQKRAEQMLRLEHQVAHALAGEHEPNEVVREVIRAVCEVEGWACGRYFRLDEASGLLRFQDAWCVADPVVRQFVERSRTITLRPGEGLSGNVWQSGEPIWSQDTVHDPRVQHKRLWEGSGLRGGFAFAVVAEGSVIGVLTFSSQAVREPDQRLVQAARVIGSQIGQFLKRKQAEESQRESELRFRSLVQMSSDFFWETDAQDRFTEMVHGPNYVDTVAGAGEAGWGELRAMFQARAPFRDFEFGRPWPDGSIRYFSVSGEPRFAAEGAFLGYRGVGRDITEIALARERIASLAYSDPLTGLANRTSLSPALEQAVERARRRGAKLA